MRRLYRPPLPDLLHQLLGVLRLQHAVQSRLLGTWELPYFLGPRTRAPSVDAFGWVYLGPGSRS